MLQNNHQVGKTRYQCEQSFERRPSAAHYYVSNEIALVYVYNAELWLCTSRHATTCRHITRAQRPLCLEAWCREDFVRHAFELISLYKLERRPITLRHAYAGRPRSFFEICHAVALDSGAKTCAMKRYSSILGFGLTLPLLVLGILRADDVHVALPSHTLEGPNQSVQRLISYIVSNKSKKRKIKDHRPRLIQYRLLSTAAAAEVQLREA